MRSNYWQQVDSAALYGARVARAFERAQAAGIMTVQDCVLLDTPQQIETWNKIAAEEGLLGGVAPWVNTARSG